MSAPLLEVEDLRVVFPGSDRRRTLAVDGVGVLGRARPHARHRRRIGCGKSVTSLAIMGLLPKGGAEVSGGVRFEGRDLLREPDRVMRDLRGNRLAMIFQEPMTSLNPSYTVGDQIVEAVVRHRKVSRQEARGARRRDAAPGPHPDAGGALPRLPAPALRRHAPARHDRDGARLRSRPPHRRRADDRARRHDPGADPRR